MTLCVSCRRSLLIQFRSTQKVRQISTTSTTQTPPASSSSHPGLSQTFSTPNFAPRSATKPLSSPSKQPKLISSIPGGQELRGLQYLKAKPPILAKEDDQYPPWLWTLLNETKADSSAPKLDLSSMTKKQRAKHDRKQEKLRKNMAKTIPIHEQSVDLTGPNDDAITSLERRQEITKSSRVARRNGIREDNFLRSM